MRSDGQALGQQHAARVQALVHLHDGHARLRVARLDGAVYGRRAPPARQQAGVNVQAAQARHLQRPDRQDEAVGGHHHHVGLHRLHRRAGRLRLVGKAPIQPQAARLKHLACGQAVRQRPLLDGRSLLFHAPAGGPVRLGEHQRHFKAGRAQALQRHAGKFGRASEDDFHGFFPGFSGFVSSFFSGFASGLISGSGRAAAASQGVRRTRQPSFCSAAASWATRRSL